MKNIIKTLILIAMITLTNSSCAQKSKTLVAYFSCTGTTEAVAKRLANMANADLLKIKPAVAYSAQDLDWTDPESRSSVEMKDKASRPMLETPKVDLGAYTTVYIGFPIWWYTAPTIINTFIENNDFKGKTIILFATSGGSTIKKAESDMRSAYPDLKFGKSYTLNRMSDKELKELIK